MGKAVLFSVRPKWCEMTAIGKKTIEVRKHAPKLPTPYKGYLYCTNNGQTLYRSKADGEIRMYRKAAHEAFSHHQVFNGKVWAEFICDADLPMMFECSDPTALTTHFEVPGTCLTDVEILDYLGNGVEGHGLHISELKIYDKPKELSEFFAPCRRTHCSTTCPQFQYYNCNLMRGGRHPLTRAPQSWCYVEELED